jgi:hypothetical protein
VASELKTVPAVAITGVSALALIALGFQAGFMSSPQQPTGTGPA